MSTVTTSRPPARPGSLAFLRAYATTMRLYLLFLSGTVGAAGVALVPSVAWTDALAVTAACFVSYGFGQALTDCFQLDTDSLSAPWRPLVRGEVRRRDVLLVSLGGLGAVVAVLAAYDAGNLVLGALGIVGLGTYTWFKRRAWAGPAYNAAIVVLVALMAHRAGLGAADGEFRWSPELAGVLGVVFFGYANFVLVGYFKDVSADRRTGYRTLPVAAGLRRSVRVADLLAASQLLAAGIAARTLAVRPGTSESGPLALGVAGLVLAGGVAAAVLGQRRLRSVRTEADAHRAIVPTVDSLLLLLLGLSALARPDWAAALAAAFLLYRIVLGRRPARDQI